MFNKETIGEKLNEILVKNNIKTSDGSSFEEAVENSSRQFKNLMEMPYDIKSINYWFNQSFMDGWLPKSKMHKYFDKPISNKKSVEIFVLYVTSQLEIIKYILKTLDYNDNKVLWFITQAIHHMSKKIGIKIEQPSNPNF